MLDIKRLRVLKEVAAQGSFSAAADQLSYTQSAVSQQIATLEREAGTLLVDRGSRGIRLTDAGRALVEHADAILARVAAAEQELEAIAGLRGGRVRMSSFPTAGAALVPLAIKSFTIRHPGIELSLVELEPDEALPVLKAGDLDIALVLDYPSMPLTIHDPNYSDVDLLHLLDDPMHLAVPVDHPAATRARVRLQDLAAEPWIQGGCKGLCGQMHIAACQAAGFEPRVGFETDDYNVAQGLVAAGVGISLIPTLALTNLRDDIVVRDLGAQAPVRRISAATLSAGHRSIAATAMLEILQEAAREFLAGRRSCVRAA